MSIYLGTTLLTNATTGGGSGGGGGLLTQIKYSTLRAVGERTGLVQDFTANSFTTAAAGSTFISFDFVTAGPYAANELVGALIEQTGGNLVITSNPAFAGGNSGGVQDRTSCEFERQDGSAGGLYEAYSIGDTIQFRNTNTVNPADDLGLSDGDLLGYFIVGAGDTGITDNNQTSTAYGGHGGRILQGTTIIETAATDLVLTVGIGMSGTSLTGGASTITGGLTLSSITGSQIAGHRGTGFSSQSLGIGASAAGTGINGYGAGDGGTRSTATSDSGIAQTEKHGYGMGGQGSSQSGDGAIILYY